MRYETQHWNKVRATLEIILGGVGRTGLSPLVAVQRVSDGLWLQNGGTWDVGFDTNSLAEVDASNLPGLYEFALDPFDLDYDAGLSGYRLVMTETTTPVREVVFVRSQADALRSSKVLWEDQIASYSGEVGSTAEQLAAAGGGATPATIAAEVWSTSKLSYTPGDGSYGELLSIILGMVQGNHRLKNPTFDAEGRMLSAQLVAYPTGAAADSDVSALAIFDVTMTYDVDGNLATLLSKE